MFSLTFSEVRASWGKVRVVEPGSGLWSLPVSRCESESCLGTGVWGEAAASVRKECVRGSELRQGGLFRVKCPFACVVRGEYIDPLSISPSRPRPHSNN